MERGLAEVDACERMRDNVRSGSFTAKHYKQMWSSRLELQADEYFEHAPRQPKASTEPKASAEPEASANVEATAVATGKKAEAVAAAEAEAEAAEKAEAESAATESAAAESAAAAAAAAAATAAAGEPAWKTALKAKKAKAEAEVKAEAEAGARAQARAQAMQAKAEAKAIADAEAAAAVAAAAVAAAAVAAEAAAAERAAVEAAAAEEKDEKEAAADPQTQAQAQAEVQAVAVAEVKADPTALAEKLRLLAAERQHAESAVLWSCGRTRWWPHHPFWPPGADTVQAPGCIVQSRRAAARATSGAQWEATAADIPGSLTQPAASELYTISTPRRRPRPSRGLMPTLNLDATSSLPSAPRERAWGAVASYSSRWQPSRRSTHTAESPQNASWLLHAEFGTRIPIEYVLCRPVMCFFKFDKIKDKMLRLPLSYLQFFMCFEARRGRQAPNVLQLFNRGV
jgi:hypothetical protein